MFPIRSSPARDTSPPMNFASSAVLAAATAVLSACSGPVTGGTGSSSSTGGGAICTHDVPGTTFTFQLDNTGTRNLRLLTGCGGTIPITVDTPSGAVPISRGSADGCEVSCDSVFKGQQNFGCSDCGPGTSFAVDAGKVTDVAWDRRGYTAYEVDPSCSGNADGNRCALGTLVDPATTKTGTVTICSDTLYPDSDSCPAENLVPVAFNLDLSKSSVVISVN